MGKIKQVFSLLERWQIVFVLAFCIFAGTTLMVFQLTNQTKPAKPVNINQTANPKIKVVNASSGKISSTLTSELPPTSVSTKVQSNTDPNSASTSPLQSNTNIHDPSLSANPLVQSLELNTDQ